MGPQYRPPTSYNPDVFLSSGAFSSLREGPQAIIATATIFWGTLRYPILRKLSLLSEGTDASTEWTTKKQIPNPHGVNTNSYSWARHVESILQRSQNPAQSELVLRHALSPLRGHAKPFQSGTGRSPCADLADWKPGRKQWDKNMETTAVWGHMGSHVGASPDCTLPI